MRLSGIYAPVTTPFHERTEALDIEGFRANLRAHLGDGVSGIVVAGSTGEAALLDDAERVALVEAARAEVPIDKALIVGTGSESTRQCIARCNAAAAAGADAVLVVAPHYYSAAMTREALTAHYRRVADESPLPVVLYNIPKYMHFALPAELVAEFAQHQNVIGIKDSSGDIEMLRGFLVAQSESFSVITGSGSGFAAGLAAGARGGILAVALFAAPMAIELMAAAAAGDEARVTALQARLTPMANVIVARLGVPGVKGALDHLGRTGGLPRLPLLPLHEAQRLEMVAALG